MKKNRGLLIALEVIAWSAVLNREMPAVVIAEQEQIEMLDNTGSVSISTGDDTETVEITKTTDENGQIEYKKTKNFTSDDGDVDVEFIILASPDPFTALHAVVENSRATPAEFDVFGTLPILPITGSAGAPKVLSRMDLILSDTGGAAGASVEPLFFSNIFDPAVQETELGGQTPLNNAGLGNGPITTLGMSTFTSGIVAGPNPATDPTVSAWNYLVPFLNLRLSAGDKVEIFAFVGIAEQNQPLDDPDAIFAELVATAGVPGDYNNNGTVDAADYVAWRDGGPLQNEVDNPGTVDQADYDFWQARFGATSGSSAIVDTAAVPEPASAVLSAVVIGSYLAVSLATRVR